MTLGVRLGPDRVPEPWPRSWEGGRLVGFAAYYIRPNVENGRDAFNVRTGQVVIMKSTRHVVEGTFHFTGGLYCGGSPPGPCHAPWIVVPDAPEIEVAGSFSAVPVRTDGNVRTG